jgi:hypothetical protein
MSEDRWVYTGDVNNEVHKVPEGPPGSVAAMAHPEIDKWKHTSGLCPDGSKPDANGNCPQKGK